MRIKALTLSAVALAMSFGLAAQSSDTVPVGTSVTVRTNDTIDTRNPSDGRIFTGVVDRDVLDNSGRVAIPRGSNAELIVRNIGDHESTLDLESISVNGRRYIVSTSDESVTAERKDGLGKNSRTGKYVGGGAAIGAIIGAIAGGGKGAAIGAATGGAAGAGAQVLTRGKDVRVPAESLVTFRLDQPLRIGRSDTREYDRDGRHYHYRQDPDR